VEGCALFAFVSSPALFLSSSQTSRSILPRSFRLPTFTCRTGGQPELLRARGPRAPPGANSAGHVEATTCSVPWRSFGHDLFEENAVGYVMQRAIFGAEGDRSVA
jgi:hypothetical protein